MRNAILYFLLFPFVGFINALKNYRSSWAKPTIIAFVAFFGMSMVKSELTDSSRYVTKLESMYSKPQSFESIQNSFYDKEEGQIDIYTTIVTYVFALFTDNGNLLFLFFGFIFGYFYVNNIWLVLDQSKGRLTWIQLLVLASFSMIIGYWAINGVRMWTAAHVFFYGAFIYLYHNQKKGLFIAVSSLLIHFSFALPIVLLLVYSLVRLNYRFLYLFYIASFFVVELNIDSIRTALENNLPDFILPKVKSYLNDEYVEGVNELSTKVNWYIAYYQRFLSYFNVVFLSIIFFKADMTQAVKKLLGFSLFFLSIANIANLLPSGGRFLNVAFLFSVATCFIILANTKSRIIIKTAKMLSPLLLLFCVVSIRTSFDFFNITTLTNPIVVLLTDINQPIIEFFK